MKLFIWQENVHNGAYHADGSAVVIAATIERAKELVAAKEADPEAVTSYKWAANLDDAPEVRELPENVAEQVVILTAGCDCI